MLKKNKKHPGSLLLFYQTLNPSAFTASNLRHLLMAPRRGNGPIIGGQRGPKRLLMGGPQPAPAPPRLAPRLSRG